MVDPGTLSGERLAILVQNALVSGEPPEGSDLAFFDTQVVDESSPCVSVAHLSRSDLCLLSLCRTKVGSPAILPDLSPG